MKFSNISEKSKRSKVKHIIVAAYLLIAIVIWQNRVNMFNSLELDKSLAIYETAETLFYISTATTLILLLMLLIIILRNPLKADRMRNKLLSIGLRNESGETPILVGQYPDSAVDNGIVYKFENNNISISDFISKESRLETVLDGNIYSYEYNNGTKYILVYCMPMKYVTLKLFDYTNEYLNDVINMLVVGSTGTGKSYFLKILLGKIASYNQDVKITICDFKKSSFTQFKYSNSFYGYTYAPKGIRAVYKEFCERLRSNDEELNKQIHVLLIDEYGALLSSLEKREAEEIKGMVAEMLFMGRSLGIRLIISIQRADAEFFKSGARDQFKAILAMGNISKEQKQMLFTDYKDKMADNNSLGEGYLFIDGKQSLERIKVQKVSDYEEYLISGYIERAMSR
ncbi:MAG: AAA family ATPase [Oscillospiraceae bacterium]|jgi:DNA replication protein DnaC|nr:AAA family ATPase [Oscillospiraceae bacterium]